MGQPRVARQPLNPSRPVIPAHLAIPGPQRETDIQRDIAGHDGVVDWRASSTAQWSKSDISIGITAHYVDSYDRPAADDEISSWTSFDARLTWSPGFLKGGVLTGGVDNLFDRAPPPDPFLEGWPFLNPALHDNRGRFAFLENRHSL